MVAAHTWRVLAARVTAVASTAIFFTVLAPPARAATLQVKAGGDFQAALHAAKPGDEIVLDAGATFTGAFVLPPKPAGPVITIRSSATLPNRRITPADALLLPRIGSGSVAPAIEGKDTANWKFDGIRLLPTHEGHYNVVNLERATNVTFDRTLFVGAEPHGQRRVILGNGRSITVTRSHFENVFRRGEESNAFCAYNGAGPYTITDNYFEVSGINILFGGAGSDTAGDAPADILVERNHLTKRWEWKSGPLTATVKNLFELKHAKRVVVRHNLMERNWTSAQNGFAVLFSTSDDSGRNPWTVIEHVTFEYNIVRDTERGINISGHDGFGQGGCSQTSNNLIIRHNLIEGGVQIGGEHDSITLDHNTFFGNRIGTLYKGGVSLCGGGTREAAYAVRRFVATNNLAYWDLFGDTVGYGLNALTRLTREYVWTHNVLAGAEGHYPDVTWKPTTADHQAQFNADHTLTATSKYKGAASDKTDLGWSGKSPAASTPTSPRNLRITR